MPTWDEILKESQVYQPLALLDKYIAALSKYTGNTVIAYISAFTLIKEANIPATLFSIVDQDIQGFMTCSKGVKKEALDLVIHSPGGDYEATKRIISYLREIYQKIRVFVPHMAMSGATVIACASDEIYMGPYSSLGPTDPQVLIGNRYVPVGAVIREFERAFEEVQKDPKRAIIWVERLKQIPLGLIQSLEVMQENSSSYLADILKRYNCRNKPPEVVEAIVKVLNTYHEHSSHGRGITLAMAQELGLNVHDLRFDKELEDRVLSIYHAATILMQNTKTTKIIANHKGQRYILHATG